MINLQKIISQLFAYKFLILVLICIFALGGGLIEARKYLIDKTQAIEIHNTDGVLLGDSSLSNNSADTPEPPTVTPTPDEKSVLGVSTTSTKNKNSSGQNTLLTVTPFPTMIPNPTAIPTMVPLPTIVPNLSTPAPTAAPTSAPASHSCAGTGFPKGVATYYNSEASKAQTVNDTATINLQLLDCSNSPIHTPTTININQSSGPNTLINGDNPPPISIETSNGIASFTVSSQTAGTAVYIVSVNSNFPDGGNTITAPGFLNPQVTFTISAPTSTPTPTAGPTPTQVPSGTSTPSPTPTSASTVTPSPSIIITTSPTPGS